MKSQAVTLAARLRSRQLDGIANRMCSHAENIHRGDLRQLLCREVAEVLGGIKEDVKQYLAGRASDRFVRSVAA